MSNRREFIKAGVIGGAALSAGLLGSAPATAKAKSGPKEILVLGGTGYIGPHMVREALRRGHSVTLFNRGRTNNTLFPDLETIKGDRDGGLDGLKGRSWDAVIDNSGYVPRHVQDSARLLSPNVGYYLYISTVAVYADFNDVKAEDAALATIEDETIEEVNGETYGALKALCEHRVAGEIDDDRMSIVRPTYICGPGDHTDRFTYYPVRATKGGAMAWPGSPSHAMSIIDVRDLANFVIDSVDGQITGTYNAATPPEFTSFGEFLEDSVAVTMAEIEPVWLDDGFIAQNEARDLFPIYFPAEGDDAARFGFSAERAKQAGMQYRPVRETIRDLMTWWNTLDDERVANARFRLSQDREAELIAAFRARQG